MYTFKITDGNGEAKEYYHIIKACYTIPVPDTKETVVTGDDLLTHRYRTSCDLYLYAENEAFTISKKNISIIQVVKEN